MKVRMIRIELAFELISCLEQWMLDLGFLCYRVGTLETCNEVLAEYCSSAYNGDRISLSKERKMKDTARKIGRNDFNLASFNGMPVVFGTIMTL